MAAGVGEMKRFGLLAATMMLVAVACSGSDVARQAGEEMVTDDAADSEPLVVRFPASLHLAALVDRALTTTLPELLVTSPLITAPTPVSVPPTTVPSTTVPPVTVPITTEPTITGDDSPEEVDQPEQAEDTFLASPLPEFVPAPPSNAASFLNLDSEGRCKPSAELELPEGWHVPPPVTQVRAAHTDAEAKELLNTVSELTSSFDAFLATDVPEIGVLSQRDPYWDQGSVSGRFWNSSSIAEELRELGFCNTGVTREVAISDLAAAFVDSYLTSLLHFDPLPFVRHGHFANPFLLYAELVESDPLHDWIKLVSNVTRSAARFSGVERLDQWRRLVVNRACYEQLDLATEEYLLPMYRERLGIAIDGFIASGHGALTRSGYSEAEIDEHIYGCINRNIYGRIPPPADLGALGRILADEISDALIEEFDTIVHAAPVGLTVTMGDTTDEQEVSARCLPMSDLPPVEFPHAAGGINSAGVYDFVNQTPYSVHVLDEFFYFVENNFSNGEAVLWLEMPYVRIRGADEYWGSRAHDADFHYRDRSRLLGDLARAGYCNDGVTRELSIGAVAAGIAFELVSEEYDYPFAASPHTYGSESLFYAEYTKGDPFHEFVTQLKAYVTQSARALPEWVYFKWPQVVAVRQCMSELGIGDDGVTSAYLDWVLDDGPDHVRLTQHDLRVITDAGYSMTAFQSRLARCYRTFASNEFFPYYAHDIVVQYFGSQLEHTVSEWLALNSDLIPSNLVIVE